MSETESNDAANSARARQLAGLRPFPKGVSGNPSGRPKKNRDLERTAESYVSEAVKVLADALKDDDAKVRIAAANALLDRARGKPKQAVEVERAPHSLDEITTDALIAAVHPAGDGEGTSSEEACH